MKTFLGVMLCCVFVAAASLAQEPDAEGCKDSPMNTRMARSKINSCDNKEYDQATFPMGDAGDKVVEGEVHTWDYGTREGVSEIQVFRNIETALKRAGFTIDYELSPMQITAHKGKTWYGLDNRGSYYDQTIVMEKAMEQEITAGDLSAELNKSGHVAVYGIHFDTGKATIQPDSEAVLVTTSPDLAAAVDWPHVELVASIDEAIAYANDYAPEHLQLHVADPESFDVTRQPNNHLSFGFGTHFCLGAALARMEIRLFFEELVRRVRGFRLVPGTEPEEMPNAFVFGLRSAYMEFDFDR